jgi:glycosyltransferase involved in cell wall biosynthesis
MKILIVPSFYPTRERPTLGVFVRDQAELLGRAGHDVTVSSLESRSIRQLGPRTIAASHFQSETKILPTHREVAYRGWNPFSQYPLGAAFWMMLAGRVAASEASSRTAGLVVSHNAILAGAAVTRCRKLRELPHIITEHSSSILSGALPPWQTALAASAYMGASCIIAVSRALATRVSQIAPSQRRIHVIPNPIATDYFRRDPGNPPNRTTFGIIANLVPIKRIDIAIKAAAILARKGLQFEFHIGGSGPEEPRLRQLVSELGVGKWISFKGKLDRPQVRSVLQRIGTLCITSEHETFGMIAAEAMSMGCFVISSNCGGPTDFVGNGNGLVLPSCDPESLASAMESRIHGHEVHDPEASRSQIEALCSEKAVAKALSDAFQGILMSRTA